MIDTKHITHKREETFLLGKEIARQLKGGEVICLYGDLGAGKSVFASGLINYFLPKKRVLSPTFIIVRHYGINDNPSINEILHLDLYRIERIEDIGMLGLDEYFNQPGKVVIIEWADRLKDRLPEKRMEIYFDISKDNERLLKFNYV